MSTPNDTSKANPTPSSDLPKVCVLGIGQMGLVCAAMLADPDDPRARVVCWGHDEDETGVLAQTRRSPRLPELILDDSIRVALSDASALEEADLIVSAVPARPGPASAPTSPRARGSSASPRAWRTTPSSAPRRSSRT
jgi:3-hydroxyisobutyrate dehydrogenase-like beta-hydroxyacid dehydrogenase